MQYYVISSDGQRYGPADIATLNQWIAEGRLLPHQLVEDASTGVRIAASSVAGLMFPQQPPTYQSYPRDPGGWSGDDGAQDLRQSWTYGAIGLCVGWCCCIFLVFPIMGIVSANKAAEKGNPNAANARIFNIVVLVLTIGLPFGIRGLTGGFSPFNQGWSP